MTDPGHLLTLDPSTASGWCLALPSHQVRRTRAGTWELPKKATIQERCYAAAQYLIDLLSNNRVIYAGIEAPMLGVSKKKKIVQTTTGPIEKEFLLGKPQDIALNWSIHTTYTTILSIYGVAYRAISWTDWRGVVFNQKSISGEESKRRSMELMKARNIYVTDHNAAEAGAMMDFLQLAYKNFMREDGLIRDQRGRAALEG